MRAEVFIPNQTETREVRRENFAPGRAGDMAYLAVSSGIPCDAFIDENKTRCGKPPIGTVDMDIKDNLEFFPFCSPEHKQLLAEQITDELEAQERYSHAGTNGFGRINNSNLPQDPQT